MDSILSSSSISTPGSTPRSHRFGSPAAAVADVCAPQVFNIDLVHHFRVLLLDLQVNEAVSLLLLLRQERPDGQVTQQSQDPQQGEEAEPL